MANTKKISKKGDNLSKSNKTRSRKQKGVRKTRSRRQRGGSEFNLNYETSKSECAYIKDLDLYGDNANKTETAITHFINNVVLKYTDNPKHKLLTNLSNLYVLMADSRDMVWRDIMSHTDYNTLEKNGKMIVAYMLLIETAEEKEYQKLKDMQNDKYKKSKYDNDEYVVFIEWINTVVSGNNLASHIIQEYESQHNYDYRGNIINNVMVLPNEILDSAVGFWADFLNENYMDYSSITDDDGILKKNNIKELIKNLKVDPKSLRWDPLFYMADGDRGMAKRLTIRDLKKSNKETSDDEDEEDDEDDEDNM